MNDALHRAPELRCSFCGKSKHRVPKFIAGPGVYICNECVGLCNEILGEDAARERGDPAASHRPETSQLESMLAEVLASLPPYGVVEYAARLLIQREVVGALIAYAKWAEQEIGRLGVVAAQGPQSSPVAPPSEDKS